MIKKTITYNDYNGNERVEDFYFNLSQAEAMEMELGTTGGLTEMVRRIVAAQDTPSIVAIFKKMIMASYGEKSPDGRRFIKSEELSAAFSQTEAYSKLFMELATNSKLGAEFVNGIVPDPPANTGEKKPANDAQTSGLTVIDRTNNQ